MPSHERISIDLLENLRHSLEGIERDLNRAADDDLSDPSTISQTAATDETVRQSSGDGGAEITAGALDVTGVIVIVTDVRGRIIYFNRGAEQLTGYSDTEVLGRSIWRTLIPKEEAGKVKLTFAELQAGQRRNRHESAVLCREGDRNLVTWSNAAIPDPSGATQYIVSSGLDITERTEREQLIRSAGQRYRRLIENTLDVIWEYELAGLDEIAARIRRGELTIQQACDPNDPEIELKARFVSPAVTRLLGFLPAEMLDMPLKQHFTPRSFRKCYELLAQQLAVELTNVRTDPIEVELEEYHKDGSVVLTRSKVQFTRDALGFPQGLAGISTNITREKQAELALQESLQQYRMLVESSPTAIAVHTRGVIVYANPKTVQMLGAKSLDEVVGRGVLDFVHPQSREEVKNRISKVLQEQTVAPAREATLLRLDGSSFEAEVVGIPIVYDGEPSVKIVVADISKRKIVEKEKREIVEIQARLDMLSPRENDVLRLVVAGKANKVIAARLKISIKTVEHHRSNLMKKMRALSVADLVRMTMLAGR